MTQERVHPEDLRAIVGAVLRSQLSPGYEDIGTGSTHYAVVQTDALLAELARTAKPEAESETIEAIRKDRDRFYDERNYWMDKYAKDIKDERERIKQSLGPLLHEDYIKSSVILKILDGQL